MRHCGSNLQATVHCVEISSVGRKHQSKKLSITIFNCGCDGSQLECVWRSKCFSGIHIYVYSASEIEKFVMISCNTCTNYSWS